MDTIGRRVRMKEVSGVRFQWQWKRDFSVENNNDAEMGTNVGAVEGELFI